MTPSLKDRNEKDPPRPAPQRVSLKPVFADLSAVVTAANGSAGEGTTDQDDLASLANNSDHRTVPGSNHQSLIDDESDAGQSSQAIRVIVDAVRRPGPSS
jgi:hypothetical protein